MFLERIHVMKHFNTTGICYPDIHYMADISSVIASIERMIQQGNYLTINRGRQYGKTTTLYLMEEKLQAKYYVINTSFEGVGDDCFSCESRFVSGFIRNIKNIIKYTPQIKGLLELWIQKI